jgi:hypothetical protein
MKKQPKVETVQLKKESKLDFSFIDRETIFPCRNCRKNDSCIIKPYDGKCLGFEEGVPWSKQYNSSLPDNKQSIEKDKLSTEDSLDNYYDYDER